MLRTLLFFPALAILALPASPQALIEIGDNVPGVGNVIQITRATINDAGEWQALVLTDNPTINRNAALVDSNGIVFQEGMTVGEPAGATIRRIDTLSLSNGGVGGWDMALDGPPVGNDSVIYRDNELVLQGGDPSLAPEFSPGTPYQFFLSAEINDRGDFLVNAVVQDPALGTGNSRALVVLEEHAPGQRTERVVVKRGDLLPGQVFPVASTMLDPDMNAFNDVGDVLYGVNLPTETHDVAIYLNDDFVAQEQTNAPVPFEKWADLGDTVLALSDNREYAFRGDLGGGDWLLIKNGNRLVRKGELLPGTNAAPITLIAPSVRIANSGDVLWFGAFAQGANAPDHALFVNRRVLVRESNGDVGGVPIETILRNDAFEISPNGRYVLYQAELADGTLGLYRLDRGELAHQEVRNGTRLNRFCLRAPDPPIIGNTWRALVDNRPFPGANFSVLLAHASSLPAMLTPYGELLIDFNSPQLIALSSHAVTVNTFRIDVPPSMALIGATGHIQAAVLHSGTIGLCNAIQPVAGL